jgi:hypothetical protein
VSLGTDEWGIETVFGGIVSATWSKHSNGVKSYDSRWGEDDGGIIAIGGGDTGHCAKHDVGLCRERET